MNVIITERQSKQDATTWNSCTRPANGSRHGPVMDRVETFFCGGRAREVRIGRAKAGEGRRTQAEAGGDRRRQAEAGEQAFARGDANGELRLSWRYSSVLNKQSDQRGRNTVSRCPVRAAEQRLHNHLERTLHSERRVASRQAKRRALGFSNWLDSWTIFFFTGNFIGFRLIMCLAQLREG